MTGTIFDAYKQEGLGDYPKQDESIVDMSWFEKNLYFQFENQYGGMQLMLWSRRHYWLGYMGSIGYLIALYALIRFMRNRQPIRWLGHALPYWNLALAIYSIIGTTRMFPYLVSFIWQRGSDCLLCSPPMFSYGKGAAGLWTGLFIYSKYFELFDTLFIVLKKSKLNFLHWYHHTTVLAYTWHAYINEMPAGLIYASINYAVHSIMYGYYFLAARPGKSRPKWGIVVTVLQILQMVIGTMVTFKSIILALTRDYMRYSTLETAASPQKYNLCFYDKVNLVFAAVIYISYLYLFAKFFVNRYVKNNKVKLE